MSAEKKAESRPAAEKPAKVAVVMVGNSRGTKAGEVREVDAATAKRLVGNFLARYAK